MGMGAMALATMLGSPAMGQAVSLAPRAPQFAAKAKRVIHIFAAGGPSHVDTFDPKPMLAKFEGEQLPGLPGLAYASPFKFSKCGSSGLEISELFPHLQTCADEMCVVRSLWTDVPSHEVASRLMHTGSPVLPKPSMGSWVLAGLGAENQNMPGFISMGGRPEWRQSSFLPAVFQGVNVNYVPGMSLNQILLNIKGQFTTAADQRRQLDLVEKLSSVHSETLHQEEQLEARIASFEMAFRMQTEATDAFDISKESQSVRDAYGNTETGTRLLVARRLAERGVRFIQVVSNGWDHHSNLSANLKRSCGQVDQPCAALIKDLKQRGMLDETLILWGGEFGRTVTRDRNGSDNPGRDHNGRGFCCWMAGGGTKGGTAYGSTDEFGGRAAEDRCHIHDLHATMLALLGFDHKKLTYRYNGRDFRLTDNFGKVVDAVIS
jgi:hypothetical protein